MDYARPLSASEWEWGGSERERESYLAFNRNIKYANLRTMDFPGSHLVTHKQLMPAISPTKHTLQAARVEQGLRVKINGSNRIRLAVGVKEAETESG